MVSLFKKKKKKVKIGLALGSGGAKGFAHLGAIKALEENGVSFDFIAGTSIGSIVGAFLAQGYTSDEITNLLSTVNARDVASAVMIKMDTVKLEDVIGKNIGDLDFSELKLPFTAVACDFKTLEEVDISSGSIAKALGASSAYPPFFKPVFVDGKYLIDGAFANSVPCDIVKKQGADYVIGIDLGFYSKKKNDASKKGYENCNIMLQPYLEEVNSTSFSMARYIYDKGYEIATENMAKIKSDIERLSYGSKIKKQK